MIPLTRPLTDEDEVRAVAEVIRSGWLVQGPNVAAFEEKLADRLGAKHAVAFSSGTTALHAAVILAGLRPGDEAIVPSYTFVASANALLHAGVKPVFGEIDPRTFNLDPMKVAALVGPRTRAVMLVHQFGLPADVDAFESLAAAHGLALIEDAACALGAVYRERAIGACGGLVAFSFHPRKSITTAEGGLLVTDDAAFAEQARLLRAHGLPVADGAPVKTLGYNYRMSDVHAALGIAQLGKLDRILRRRRELAERYDDALRAIGWLEPPHVPEWAIHPYQTYAALVARGAPAGRDDLIARLRAREIASRPGIVPIHRQPYVASPARLPITDDVSARTLILPLYPQMTEAEQDQVLDAFRSLG